MCEKRGSLLAALVQTVNGTQTDHWYYKWTGDGLTLITDYYIAYSSEESVIDCAMRSISDICFASACRTCSGGYYFPMQLVYSGDFTPTVATTTKWVNQVFPESEYDVPARFD